MNIALVVQSIPHESTKAAERGGTVLIVFGLLFVILLLVYMLRGLLNNQQTRKLGLVLGISIAVALLAAAADTLIVLFGNVAGTPAMRLAANIFLASAALFVFTTLVTLGVWLIQFFWGKATNLQIEEEGR